MLLAAILFIKRACLQDDIERAPAKPVNDNDDIFGDAGTNYVPELPKSKASDAAAAAPAPAAGSYFDKKDEMADLPALPKAGTPECRQGLLLLPLSSVHALAVNLSGRHISCWPSCRVSFHLDSEACSWSQD